jgi:RNA polymerase sigma-70 factor, ECF subfamily
LNQYGRRKWGKLRGKPLASDTDPAAVAPFAPPQGAGRIRSGGFFWVFSVILRPHRASKRQVTPAKQKHDAGQINPLRPTEADLLDADQQTAVAQGLLAGRPEAWTTLYDAYAADVWRYAARLLGGDPSGVADVVQETLLAAARSARSFDPTRGTLASWLMGITHRQAAQHFRRSLRTPVAAPHEHQNLQSAVSGPIDELLKREQAQIVRQVLADMPAEHAWLLTAKYVDGEPIAALSQKLGMGEEAVRSKLARARRLFRQAMGRGQQAIRR